MAQTYNPRALVSVSKDLVSSPLGDEAVILSLACGQYFSLNPVAAVVWARLKTPASVAELRAVILDTFEVNEEVGERDLHAFLEALLKRKLIEIENG